MANPHYSYLQMMFTDFPMVFPCFSHDFPGSLGHFPPRWITSRRGAVCSGQQSRETAREVMKAWRKSEGPYHHHALSIIGNSNFTMLCDTCKYRIVERVVWYGSIV